MSPKVYVICAFILRDAEYVEKTSDDAQFLHFVNEVLYWAVTVENVRGASWFKTLGRSSFRGVSAPGGPAVAFSTDSVTPWSDPLSGQWENTTRLPWWETRRSLVCFHVTFLRSSSLIGRLPAFSWVSRQLLFRNNNCDHKKRYSASYKCSFNFVLVWRCSWRILYSAASFWCPLMR